MMDDDNTPTWSEIAVIVAFMVMWMWAVMA